MKFSKIVILTKGGQLSLSKAIFMQINSKKFILEGGNNSERQESQSHYTLSPP